MSWGVLFIGLPLESLMADMSMNVVAIPLPAVPTLIAIVIGRALPFSSLRTARLQPWSSGISLARSGCRD